MAAKARGNETVGDAVRSLVVVIGLVAAVVIAFTVMKPDARLPDPVDYTDVLGFVRDEYAYDPAAPTPSPEGWRATSVEHSDNAAGDRWRLGFLTPDEGFVGLEQSNGEIQSFLDDRLTGFADDGEADVDGATWQRMVEDDRSPDRALVLVEDGVATIVRGTEPYEVLEEFAASLG